MNRMQLAILLLALATEALAGLLPANGDGYQYDRPAFGTDFGEPATATRRPIAAPVGAPGFSNFPRQHAGNFGFLAGQLGYPGYQGFQGNIQNYQGYRQGDGSPGYQGYYGYGNGRPNIPSRPYNFEYAVRDPVSGNDYGQREASDAAGAVRGEYRVLLPDSRTQVVRYRADDAEGYVADVRYEGEARRRYYPGVGETGFFGRTSNGGYYPGAGALFQPGRPGVAAAAGVGGGLGYNSATTLDGFGYASGNQYLPPGSLAGSYGK